MVLCWVGIPLLRFHLHPSQCRSIGQAIGLTAYSPQRAAIFTMPPHSNLPRLFRLGALFEPLDIPTTCGAYCPFRDCLIRPSRSGVCQTFKLQGLAYSTTRSRELALAQLWSLDLPCHAAFKTRYRRSSGCACFGSAFPASGPVPCGCSQSISEVHDRYRPSRLTTTT